MTAADIGDFSNEITAAVALVLFNTFEDLGIDPMLLADRYSGLSDMAFLMKKAPQPPQRGPNAPVMTLAEAAKQLNNDSGIAADDNPAPVSGVSATGN